MPKRKKHTCPDGYIVDVGFDAVDFNRKRDAISLAKRICAGKEEDFVMPEKVTVWCSGSGGEEVVYACDPAQGLDRVRRKQSKRSKR